MHKDGRACWARTIRPLTHTSKTRTFVQLETLLYKSLAATIQKGTLFVCLLVVCNNHISTVQH